MDNKNQYDTSFGKRHKNDLYELHSGRNYFKYLDNTERTCAL